MGCEQPAGERTGTCSRGEEAGEKTRADLNALAALRIWKLHRDEPWKRLEYMAEFCGYAGCKSEWAEYKERRKRGHAVEPISGQARTEMSDARARALSLFQYFFPWGKPLNYPKS
jgi:hypothetical protein